MDGNLHYNGEVIRNKGDLYLVDCAVTGSKSGTADNSKFSLMQYFMNNVFEAVKDLVKIGGKYEGYKTIIQGDNAGPHNDAVFRKFVDDYCEKEQWHWIPQGPQMPHMNVCDLSVFPGMSKQHSKLSRDHHSMHVLTEDQIWETVKQVEKDLPSAKIASGFVQAYRLAAKVIEHKGDNAFLSSSGGGIRTGVSKDFIATEKGIKQRDGMVFPAPEPNP